MVLKVLLQDVFLYAVNVCCYDWLIKKLLWPMASQVIAGNPRQRQEGEWQRRDESQPPKQQHIMGCR